MKKNFFFLVIAVPVPVLVKKMTNTNKMFEIFSEHIKKKEKSKAKILDENQIFIILNIPLTK